MRKKFFFMTALCLSFAVAAQDTVRYGDMCYMFNPLQNGAGWNSGWMKDDVFYTAAVIFLQQYIAREAPTPVYGIAATMDLNPDMPDSVLGVRLWQKEGDMLVCIDSVVGAAESVREFEYVILEDTLNGLPVVPPEYQKIYVPCYEYYFSQPHVMSDTFYISFKYSPNVYAFMSYHNVQNGGYRGHASICVRNGTGTWYEYANGVLSRYLPFGQWGVNFPILRPYCPKPEAPTVTLEGMEAVFEWAEGNAGYELAVTQHGMPSDSAIMVFTTDTSCSLTDLDSGVWYSARVRAACSRYDSLWWSDWSLPTHFYLGSANPDSLGIARMAVQPAVDISPNPASGAATVHAEQGIRYIEVYDTRGARVYAASCDGQPATTLDSKAWPAGLYIVTVETPGGKASGMLTVKH